MLAESAGIPWSITTSAISPTVAAAERPAVTCWRLSACAAAVSARLRVVMSRVSPTIRRGRPSSRSMALALAQIQRTSPSRGAVRSSIS